MPVYFVDRSFCTAYVKFVAVKLPLLGRHEFYTCNVSLVFPVLCEHEPACTQKPLLESSSQEPVSSALKLQPIQAPQHCHSAVVSRCYEPKEGSRSPDAHAEEQRLFHTQQLCPGGRLCSVAHPDNSLIERQAGRHIPEDAMQDVQWLLLIACTASSLLCCSCKLEHA